MEISRRHFIAGSVSGLPVLPSLVQEKSAPVPPPEDLPYLSIGEAAALIRRSTLSSVQLTRAVLERIDRIEPKVHAFVTVAREEAMRAAELADQEIRRGRYRGPLHGIPFGVKDTHYTKGIRTTAATPVLADFVPSFDATIVARLKAAGGVLIGKTTLPEFSFGGATPGTNNPWDLKRSPGGSSGGSGAALAAGLLIAATGGDTSGSIRNPAAVCGVVGMKPTYGRVSRHGIIAISWSLDHVGPMTRTVADNAIMLGVIAGRDPMDDTCADVPVPDYTKGLRRGLSGMRIGVPKRPMFEGFHPDVILAFDEAIARLRKMGARITEVDMPSTLKYIDDAQQIIRIAEAASYHEKFLATEADRYGPSEVRSDVEAGSLIAAVQYLRAQKVRGVFVKQMREMFRQIDVFLTPGMPAPAGVSAEVPQPFRRMFNVCGFPAMCIPAGFSTSPQGLPLSLQMAALPFAEESIYAVAHAYESQTRWYQKRPAL